MKRLITLHVNGDECELVAAPHRTLLEVLRDDLGLTGTKRGCDFGSCGSCTVLINGKPALSCLTLAAAVQRQPILTIEGLGTPAALHPVQDAFVRTGAIQCGFCTPGMVLTAKAFLDEHPHPTERQVRKAISGNICRCTGYTKIV